MNTALTPIKPDYTQPWVRGWEYILTEGTTFWTRLREERGWTREQVHELTDYVLSPAEQELLEGEWGPGMPTLAQLELLAVLYGRRPGELLDECYEEKGYVLIAEDDDA